MFVFVLIYPAIEVVTFCLRGWCMLGLFVLLAFTRLGHKSFESVRWNTCALRLDLGLYSHPKESGGVGGGGGGGG